MIPGDPERESEISRRVKGIPVIGKVVADLEELADRYSIKI